MDINELKVTAELARLPMSEEDLRKAYPAFEQMLEYFTAMHTGSRDKTAKDGRPEELPGRFRPDSPLANGPHVSGEEFLERSGGRDGQYIVIPNVL